ncbi:hypothetical protein [Thalassotalea sp. PP2-459]|uniref:hypothetical protein n=1 Tax=Thalassotalea sp. PP2-459 TaxID=1742724 RepID=UPI00094459B7|nr:hypothetical protein [Thalassotalea sp. PP2-459]OKY25208.1 hypothetical protein BI291_04165 [Thalassotalea sp. PP2-459]
MLKKSLIALSIYLMLMSYGSTTPQSSNYISPKSSIHTIKNYFEYVSEITWDFYDEPYFLEYDAKTKLIWAIQDDLYELPEKKNFTPLFQHSIYDATKRHYSYTIRSIYLPTVFFYKKWNSEKDAFDLQLHKYPIALQGSANLKFDDSAFIGTIDNLVINGVKQSFTFPTISQLEKSKEKYKKLTAFYERKHHIFINDNSGSIKVNIHKSGRYEKEYAVVDSKCLDTPNYSGTSERCKKWSKTEYEKPRLAQGYGNKNVIDNIPMFLVKVPSSKYEKVIHSNLSSSDKLKIITNLLTEERLKVKKPTLSKVSEPQYLKQNVLIKGEFEKSADYQKRKTSHKLDIKQKNQNLRNQFELAKISANQDFNSKMEAYKSAVTRNKEENIITQAANESAKQAITMVYGDPKFKDIKYDADKEMFSANVYSRLNSFNMNVDIPVHIDEAESFKKKMSEQYYVPSIKFSVNSEKLTFNNLKVVSNQTKQEQDFKIAKSKNTVLSYSDFITLNPKAPQTKIAKQKIDEILEAKRIAKAKAEKEAKERAKRAAEAKAREQKAYMKEKFVGDKVCMSGSMAFGFINPTISGFVEGKNGNNIQIRIANTDGTSPHYNGVTLRANLLIWDSYYSWKHCN